MGKPLQVLIIDDSEDDALLMIHVLNKGGYDPQYERVEDALAMRQALAKGHWDIILCDYLMPQFNGLAAIALLKETGIDIPLIIVSGAIGEEMAVECMRLGANDYIMKDNTTRLASAIERELKDAESRHQRKQAEKQLQKNQALLAETEKIGKVGGWEFNIDTGKQSWTEEVNNIHEVDLTYDPTVEKGISFYTPTSRPIIERAVQRAIEHGEPFDVELEIITAKGRLRSVHAIGKADIEHRRVYGFFQDITERKQVEEDLRQSLRQLQEARDMLVQSEKLAAIGTLAAGVTHEILNPLNIISLYLQMLDAAEIPTAKVMEVIEICQRQVERIAKISKDLNQFARQEMQEIAMGDINHLLGQTFNLITPKLRVNQVETDLQLQSDLPSIPLDKNRLGQVFLNLVNNAVDAMEGVSDKALRVRTELVTVAEKESVRVVFADRGTGIPEEIIRKIFDPFFTTKEPGKGTGLGLSITYRIIQDHGGRIWAENNAGGGASFFIELPVKPPSVLQP